LLLRSLDERRAHIETGLAPVWAGELSIDVDRASGVLAARRVGIGRDEAIDQRFHRRGLAGVEKEPRPLMNIGGDPASGRHGGDCALAYRVPAMSRNAALPSSSRR
jgi:hypothetical protein